MLSDIVFPDDVTSKISEQCSSMRFASLPSQFMSIRTLRNWRYLIAVSHTIIWLYCTLDYGLDYIFYYSNWGSGLTLLALWLLAFSHDHDSCFHHELALDVFEVALAMEYMINILYWKLLFNSSLINIWDPTTFRGPFLNHFLPWVLLNIELLISDFHFKYPYNLRYFTVLIPGYILMNLYGTYH